MFIYVWTTKWTVLKILYLNLLNQLSCSWIHTESSCLFYINDGYGNSTSNSTLNSRKSLRASNKKRRGKCGLVTLLLLGALLIAFGISSIRMMLSQLYTGKRPIRLYGCWLYCNALQEVYIGRGYDKRNF
jgi:hypothetical protein